MSEYIRTNKFDTNECSNKYLCPIYSNIWIYSSHSGPGPNCPLFWGQTVGPRAQFAKSPFDHHPNSWTLVSWEGEVVVLFGGKLRKKWTFELRQPGTTQFFTHLLPQLGCHLVPSILMLFSYKFLKSCK